MKNPLARARASRHSQVGTSTAAPATGSRLSRALADRSVRSRVLLAVSVPMTLAAVLGGTQVASSWTEAREVGETAAAATVLVPLAEMVASGAEATAVHRAALGDGTGAAQALREVERGGPAADVAAATRSFATVVDDAGFSVEQAALAGTLVRVVEELSDPMTHTTRASSVSTLRQLQRASSQLVAAIQAEQVSPEPLIGVVGRTAEGQVSLAVQQVLAQGKGGGRDARSEELAEIGAEAAVIESLGQSLGVYDPTVERLRQQNASHRDAATFGLNASGHAESAALYADLTADLVATVEARLDAAAARAERAAWVLVLVLTLAVVAALAVAVVVARSVVRPLRALTVSAQELAQHSLPRAVATLRAGGTAAAGSVGIDSADEVGTLALAVDDLHASALALAGDEVRTRAQMDAMLVTLSRRSTSLVNQQLTLIEKLEGAERDPAVLEQYFRLDHLAVRMRRTAESLLVLAGEQPQRRTEALTLSDVAHAACAGVADYQRVEIVGLQERAVVEAAVVGDLVHLLTELVDNAVTFSPPGTGVRISVAMTGDGAHVRVSDRGLGIGAEQMAALNEVLREPGAVTEATPRRMGIFVVARLAQRHAVRVRLVSNALGGTTAEVHLPSQLVRVEEPRRDVLQAAQPVAAPVTPPVIPPVPPRLVPAPVPAGVASDAPGRPDHVAESEPLELTDAGLPARRSRTRAPEGVHVPGRRVRGEVAGPGFEAFGSQPSVPEDQADDAPQPRGDADALRALLSAHQSGVARAGAGAAGRGEEA